MVIGTYVWQEVKGVFTPGGDPCWRCPNCGGDQHVMGIETSYNHHNECKECKTKLIYPYEKTLN